MDGATVENEVAAAPPSQNQTRLTQPQQGTLVDEAARVATRLNDKLPTLSQETRIPDNHRAAPNNSTAREPLEPLADEAASGARAAATTAFESSGRAESTQADASANAATTPVQTDARGGGRMRQRAASVGASVGGNLRPRVEKLREASTVVFDEASDDPGLRFVIVAALLFLLFLFILLFSYILG